MSDICQKCDAPITEFDMRRCEKHSFCDQCGAHKELIWAIYSEGLVLCRGCWDRVHQERIETFQKTEPDSDDFLYLNNPKCPYCGFEECDWHEWCTEGNHCCSRCNSEFQYCIEYNPSISTYKLHAENQNSKEEDEFRT